MDNNTRIENYIMNNMTEDICIVDDTGRYSYLQMKNEIYAVQKIIRSYGMMPGDKIVILSPNGKNAIVSIFATLNINCVAAPVDSKRLIFRYDRKIPDYFSVVGAP